MNKKTNYTTKTGLHALVWKEGDWYVSKGLEIKVASQGKTKKEAIKNIEEAIELYLEDEKVTPKSDLQNLELISIHA